MQYVVIKRGNTEIDSRDLGMRVVGYDLPLTPESRSQYIDVPFRRGSIYRDRPDGMYIWDVILRKNVNTSKDRKELREQLRDIFRRGKEEIRINNNLLDSRGWLIGNIDNVVTYQPSVTSVDITISFMCQPYMVGDLVEVRDFVGGNKEKDVEINNGVDGTFIGFEVDLGVYEDLKISVRDRDGNIGMLGVTGGGNGKVEVDLDEFKITEQGKSVASRVIGERLVLGEGINQVKIEVREGIIGSNTRLLYRPEYRI